MRKIALIALLLMTCISGAAFAQEATPEATPQFCGTLSDEDCAILGKSQQAMALLNSASVTSQIDLTISNMPDISEPVTISITGSGSYSGLNKLRTDAAAAATAPGQLLVALLTDFNADVTVTIDLPPETQRLLGTAIRDSHLTFQERLVDGIGYLNMDTLQTFTRGSSLRGWYGLDVANFFKSALQQMPELFNNPTTGMNMSEMQAYQKDFSDPAFINRFIKIERTDDGSGSSASFDISVNAGALVGSHEFQAILRQQMQTQNTSMTDAEIDQGLAATLQAAKGMDINLTETIDTEDGYLQSIKGSFVFDATGMMATMNTVDKSATATAAPMINLDFSYSYSNFNDAPQITAPPNAIIIPYQSLLRGVANAKTA